MDPVKHSRAQLAGLDGYKAYRQMFGGAQDGLSAWWYLGTLLVDLEGLPTIPVLHIETVMIYRTATVSPDVFRMDWWEIGYMRDPVTGEVAEAWTNPVTGRTVAPPQKFEEGPAHFMVHRDGCGVRLELVQPHARIESVGAVLSQIDGRVMLQQTETKLRGFPLPDGKLPSLDSAHVSQARTRLTMFSAIADLDTPGAPSSGVYDFELAPPAWMGFGDRPGRSVTRGIMVKTPVNQRLNPVGWERLKRLFPDRFMGDEIAPRWA